MQAVAPRDPNPTLGPQLLVDAHVHFHGCFDLETFLNAAAENFSFAAKNLDDSPRPLGVLVMTEAEGSRYFQPFRAGEKGARSLDKWSLSSTRETFSLLAHRRGNREASLLLIEGRQITTAEGLEVLGIASDVEFSDRRPCREVLQAVRDSGGLVVLPWGVGKWWLRRGDIVARLIEQEDPAAFFLGDNGGRLGALRRPPVFARAERRGIRVLPGSDPLPFPREIVRPGSFGFRLRASLDGGLPAQSLRNALWNPAFRPEAYGSGSSMVRFLRNQAAMQLRKRAARRE